MLRSSLPELRCAARVGLGCSTAGAGCRPVRLLILIPAALALCSPAMAEGGAGGPGGRGKKRKKPSKAELLKAAEAKQAAAAAAGGSADAKVGRGGKGARASFSAVWLVGERGDCNGCLQVALC